MIGTTIGRYRVVSKLGEGGMGSIWLADDPVLGRSVALKVLPQSSAHSPEARERLLREARAACRLHHAGIATVYEAGEDDGRIYLAFEHVDGETVAERVQREGPLPVDEALRITREVAEALGHAHHQGVLHRDITSGNVMLDSSGQAKLVDFGLALPEGETRLTRPDSTPGTIAYIAPEVVMGERADRRADLWGLGVVLYEMLTGRLPFERDRAEAVLYAVVHEEPVSPRRHRADLPVQVEAVVLRALAKDPRQRFAGAGELIGALKGRAADEGPRSLPWLRRVSLAVASAVALAVVVWWLWPTDARFESVAVLPLEFSGPNAEENAYLATGLADALVTRLGRVENLRVSPWVTSRRYPPHALPLPDIGEELNVESLVVGSFREEEGRLVIEMSLRDSRTGASRWSAEFEDTRIGLLELQEDMVRALAKQLRSDLTPEEIKALVRRPTDHADAYDHYLRGAAALQEGTPEGIEEALAHFETALAIDPRLAEAHVGVGGVHLARSWLGWESYELLALAEQSFGRALDRDPMMHAARRGLMRVYFQTGHTEECLRLARDLRDQREVSFDALLAQAEGMAWGGLPEEAIPLLETLRRQDPANHVIPYVLIFAYVWSGDPVNTIRAGEEYLRNFREASIFHAIIAGAHQCLGNRAAALRHYERALELFDDGSDPWVPGAVAVGYLELVGRQAAREVAIDGIRRLETRAGRGSSSSLDASLVELYAIAGDTTRVLELGRRLQESSPPWHKGVPYKLASAYAEVGEKELANRLLLDLLELLRNAGSRPPLAGDDAPGTGGVPFEPDVLSECDGSGLGSGPLVPKDLPASADLVEAMRREQDRRRALYGR